MNVINKINHFYIKVVGRFNLKLTLLNEISTKSITYCAIFLNIFSYIILKYTLKLSITILTFKFTNRIFVTISMIEMLVFRGLEILI
jgi:hypothetical protein